MKYCVRTDSDGYVQSIIHTNNRKLDIYELDLEQYDLSGDRIHAYLLGKNQLIFDQAKYDEMEAAKQRLEDDREIEELEKNLNSTDYIIARTFEEVMGLTNPLTWIADVIKILIKYSNKYREQLANRKTWRQRIEELRERS